MKKSLNNSRKTIGILINEIDGWYGPPILKGIKKVALERDINLLIFPGRAINSTVRDEQQHNAVYNIINKQKLDGLIIACACLFNYIGSKESESFLDSFKDVPLVSIALEVPNTLSLVFDNKLSMYSIVKHLIEAHNYTRIAFISGLPSNSEARDRYEGYVAALKEHNIPLDKNYIVEGDFTEDSGSKAVELLFQQIKIKPQAIVASNDQMAVGASHKLKEMGVKIGRDIALTGFDNSDEVKFFTPPLTTVSQPTFKMGSLAAEYICDLLDGKSIDPCINIKGELVVRQSCGCLNIQFKKTTLKNAKLLSTNIDFDLAVQSFSTNLDNNKEKIILSVLEPLTISLSEIIETKKIIADFLDDLYEDIKAKNIKGRFLESLNYILSEDIALKNQAVNWNNFILSFRDIILQYATNYEILSLAEDIFYAACILTNSILTRFESYDIYNFRKLFRETLQTSEDFNTTLCREDLIEMLKKYMLKVDIKQCYLCLYDNPTIYLPDNLLPLPDKVNLFLCHTEKDEPYVECFDTYEMLPDKYLHLEERSDLLFTPLFIGSLHFGYIVFSVNNLEENIFETLREQISHSLNSQLLLNERKKAEEQLQIAVNKLEKYNHELHNLSIIDELTGLYNRRGFYIQSDKYYHWASSNSESFILFYGDLDGLKKINDTFGHKYGDEALKAAGKMLQKAFRNSDILSRLGGDEFTALATNISASYSLQLILERINSSFTEFNESATLPFTVSISIGYSIYEPNSQLSFDELIQRADANLYKEKKKRRGILN